MGTLLLVSVDEYIIFRVNPMTSANYENNFTSEYFTQPLENFNFSPWNYCVLKRLKFVDQI